MKKHANETKRGDIVMKDYIMDGRRLLEI